LDSVAVFKVMVKGAAVTGAPELFPSTLNCTLVVSAETFVKILMVPVTDAPETGDVIATVGPAEVALLLVALVRPTHPEVESASTENMIVHKPHVR